MRLLRALGLPSTLGRRGTEGEERKKGERDGEIEREICTLGFQSQKTVSKSQGSDSARCFPPIPEEYSSIHNYLFRFLKADSRGCKK